MLSFQALMLNSGNNFSISFLTDSSESAPCPEFLVSVRPYNPLILSGWLYTALSTFVGPNNSLHLAIALCRAKITSLV